MFSGRCLFYPASFFLLPDAHIAEYDRGPWFSCVFPFFPRHFKNPKTEPSKGLCLPLPSFISPLFSSLPGAHFGWGIAWRDLQKNNVTKSSLKLRSLMIFTPGTSRHSTLTEKPKPKWQSLGVGRPKKGAFKRALFAPSFLLPSSLFFSSWCAFWLKFFAARFAK